MKVDIRDDIKEMLASDIVIVHVGFTVDSFFSYLSSEIKDAEAINNINYVGELVHAHMAVNAKANFMSQALSFQLKAIKNSK
jgi:hypothetical protein